MRRLCARRCPRYAALGVSRLGAQGTYRVAHVPILIFFCNAQQQAKESVEEYVDLIEGMQYHGDPVCVCGRKITGGRRGGRGREEPQGLLLSALTHPLPALAQDIAARSAQLVDKHFNYDDDEEAVTPAGDTGATEQYPPWRGQGGQFNF